VGCEDCLKLCLGLAVAALKDRTMRLAAVPASELMAFVRTATYNVCIICSVSFGLRFDTLAFSLFSRIDLSLLGSILSGLTAIKLLNVRLIEEGIYTGE
jgi:hypothetical protein